MAAAWCCLFLNDVSLKTVNQKLWKILIYYRLSHFYFLNKDISVTIYVIDLIFLGVYS